MKDQLVNFETAKLAKEKGFPQRDKWILQDDYYLMHSSGREIGLNDSDLDIINSIELEAPTQSLLQKWLREECGLYLLVEIDHILEEICFKWRILKKNYGISSIAASTLKNAKNTYEEALEEGLQEGLNLLKV